MPPIMTLQQTKPLNKKDQGVLMRQLERANAGLKAGKKTIKSLKTGAKKSARRIIGVGTTVMGAVFAGAESAMDDGDGWTPGGYSVAPILATVFAVSGALGVGGDKIAPTVERFGTGALSFYAGQFTRAAIMASQDAKQLVASKASE